VELSILSRNVGCLLSTALRADFQCGVHTTCLSISTEILENHDNQPVTGGACWENEAITKEYGACATPYVSTFLGHDCGEV
jgi:hypothetical protein